MVLTKDSWINKWNTSLQKKLRYLDERRGSKFDTIHRLSGQKFLGSWRFGSYGSVVQIFMRIWDYLQDHRGKMLPRP